MIFNQTNETLDEYYTICNLLDHNVDDPHVKKLVEAKSMKKINTNCQKPMTELKDGVWRIVHNMTGVECKARCHKWLTADDEVKGEWTMVEKKMDCEHVESICTRNGTIIYVYIHTQIVEVTTIKPKKHDYQPNVIVILLDALSYVQSLRFLNKTREYMLKNYASVEFPYVNKVALNSKPNGVALWYGKHMGYKIDRTMFGGEVIEPEWSRDGACKQYFDNETSLFDEFRDSGYVTLQGDDWTNNMLTWSNCKSYKKVPWHHQLHVVDEKNIKKHLWPDSCYESYHTYFKYLKQFLNSYKDKPKFTWLWSVLIGHDEYAGFRRIDDYLMRYFERNRKILDESFVFLMSDHGRWFEGMLEGSNPYLSISIPRKLRNTTVMLDIMRSNAKKLQTHYDTRATMLDILKFQPLFNFTATEYHKIPNEKGSSLLRQQPDTPRTCGTLPIPTEFCICAVPKVKINDPKLNEKFGRSVATKLNMQLVDKNFTEKCIMFEYKTTTSLKLFEKQIKSEVSTYEINVEMAAPSNSTFVAYISWNNNSNVVEVKSYTRTDKFGSQGNCLEHASWRPFCYCKP